MKKIIYICDECKQEIIGRTHSVANDNPAVEDYAYCTNCWNKINSYDSLIGAEIVQLKYVRGYLEKIYVLDKKGNTRAIEFRDNNDCYVGVKWVAL